MSEGDEYGSLALPEIIAGRLARFRWIAENPKDVISKLECLTDRNSIVRESSE
jgi:hypothetical protein